MAEFCDVVVVEPDVEVELAPEVVSVVEPVKAPVKLLKLEAAFRAALAAFSTQSTD